MEVLAAGAAMVAAMVVVLGAAMVVVLGAATVVVLGAATVVVLGAATVVALGAATVAGFTAADVFSARVLASMATATHGGGIGTIRATPIILTRITAIPTTAIRTTAIRTTAIRTTVIRTMAARTTATCTPAIRTTETVILAHPLPRRSKRHSHGAATIAVRLTAHLGRRLVMQFVHSRRIKACRLPANWTAG